jgi:hypothetical protein
MSDQPSLSLEQRIDRLERGVRRWKWTAGAVALVAITLAGVGAAERQNGNPVADVVRARRFEVVGAKGEIQAYLGTINGNSDFGMLRLFDDQGKERFTARTGEKETFVYVVNDKQQVGITAHNDDKQGAGITISTTEPNGPPYGKVIWQAP